MAVYYRWRRRTVSYNTEFIADAYQTFPDFGNTVYTMNQAVSIVDGAYDFSAATALSVGGQVNLPSGYFAFSRRPTKYYHNQYSQILYGSNYVGSPVDYYELKTSYGSTSDYVYSTNASAYPNGGVSGSYYYDQRTTVTSPTAPTGLTYPNPITTPKVTVSWNAATSNVPDYSVSLYEVSYSTNGGSSWTVAGTTASTSYSFGIPAGTTSITFRVRARDSNIQWGNYVTGTASHVILAPTLTVPSQLMQGQQATISWTAISGADSYTVQRKANTDTDWTQVYSGANLSYTETVGTWTSVQYRVQAVFDGTGGGWAESNSIPVISASALVISGSDSDLGTLVDDVQYTINTDTGNQITAKITVNSAVVFSGNVTSGAVSTISIFDLVNGTGTIVIEASVQASSGVVNATRTWTYTKAELTFPDTGSIAQLLQKGKNIFPKTLAECVRLPGGRTLDEITGFPCQVYSGSYIGTGTYGQDNAIELSFPFEPQMLFVFARALSAQSAFGWVRGQADGFTISGSGNGTYIINRTTTIVWGEKTVSWYATNTVDNAGYHLNKSGVKYDYVALG